MTTGRFDHAAVTLSDGRVLVAGGRVYVNVGGGFGFAPSTASAEIFNPTTRQWTPTGSMLQPRDYFPAVRLADRSVLVAGGEVASRGPGASAERFDPDNGSWSWTGSMAFSREYEVAALLHDGRVLVAGGYGCRWQVCGVLRSSEIYSPTTGAWTQAADMTMPRAYATATALPDGRVLVAGGDCQNDPVCPSDGYLNQAEIYDPATNSWTRTPPMPSARFRHSAVLLADGSVMVVSGFQDAYPNNTLPTSTGAIWSPVTGIWRATAPSIVPRTDAEAVGLPDGRVLLAAGTSIDVYEGAAPSEIYDARVNRWTLAAPMSQGRYDFSITTLANGEVLAAGGWWHCFPPGVLDTAEVWSGAATLPATDHSVVAGVLNPALNC